MSKSYSLSEIMPFLETFFKIQNTSTTQSISLSDFIQELNAQNLIHFQDHLTPSKIKNLPSWLLDSIPSSILENAQKNRVIHIFDSLFIASPDTGSPSQTYVTIKSFYETISNLYDQNHSESLIQEGIHHFLTRLMSPATLNLTLNQRYEHLRSVTAIFRTTVPLSFFRTKKDFNTFQQILFPEVPSPFDRPQSEIPAFLDLSDSILPSYSNLQSSTITLEEIKKDLLMLPNSSGLRKALAITQDEYDLNLSVHEKNSVLFKELKNSIPKPMILLIDAYHQYITSLHHQLSLHYNPNQYREWFPMPQETLEPDSSSNLSKDSSPIIPQNSQESLEQPLPLDPSQNNTTQDFFVNMDEVLHEALHSLSSPTPSNSDDIQTSFSLEPLNQAHQTQACNISVMNKHYCACLANIIHLQKLNNAGKPPSIDQIFEFISNPLFGKTTSSVLDPSEFKQWLQNHVERLIHNDQINGRLPYSISYSSLSAASFLESITEEMNFEQPSVDVHTPTSKSYKL